MTPEKIISVIEMYEEHFSQKDIPKVRIYIERDIVKQLVSLSEDEMLAYAHFLTDSVKEYAKDPKRQREARSHLAFLQTCLFLAGWYTLEEIMEHNRSNGEKIVSTHSRCGGNIVEKGNCRQCEKCKEYFCGCASGG